VVVVLGIVGLGVEGELRPTSLSVPGTASAEGAELLREEFGDSAPFVVLLRGAPGALDRQGPRLVRALRREPGVTTLSPWDKGHLDRLRPGPRRALVLVDFHVGASEAVRESTGELDQLLAAHTNPPVRATQTGYATLARAIRDESVHSTKVAELVAVPILLVVLLLVFRSPVAALIPLLFGAATVLSVRTDPDRRQGRGPREQRQPLRPKALRPGKAPPPERQAERRTHAAAGQLPQRRSSQRAARAEGRARGGSTFAFAGASASQGAPPTRLCHLNAGFL
jgi:hypothetical protein